jgi:hypothetical protein
MLVGTPARAGVVAPLEITTTALPSAVVGQSYDVVLSAIGGTPPYSWSVSTGALPGGFLLSSLGTLLGLPSSAGTATVTLRVSDSAGLIATRIFNLVTTTPPPPPAALLGVSASGGVSELGLAGPLPLAFPLSSPVVAIAAPASGAGAWIVTASGQVQGLGVLSYGSVGARHRAGAIVAIAALPSGGGYYLLSSKGHVYGFGAAHSHGSATGRAKAVGIAVPADGRGYLVALANGTVEAFGGAANHGGVVRKHLKGRIVGIAALSGGGYVVAATGGRISRFGAARRVALPDPRPTSAVGIAASPTGGGYYVVAADGEVLAGGSAHPLGNLSSSGPIVGVSATS